VNAGRVSAKHVAITVSGFRLAASARKGSSVPLLYVVERGLKRVGVDIRQLTERLDWLHLQPTNPALPVLFFEVLHRVFFAKFRVAHKSLLKEIGGRAQTDFKPCGPRGCAALP
jgi:hypothetical protein